MSDQLVQMLEAHVFDSYVELIMKHGMKKIISIHDFIHSLQQTAGVDEKILPMYLPSNTYIFNKTGNSMIISCYYAESKREIQFQPRSSRTIQKIPVVFPNIIISHTLKMKGANEWQIQTSRFFCTDKSLGELPFEFINRADPTNHIWAVPFSNTYEDARMCYGSNTMPYVFKDNFRGMDWYYQFLYSTPFNEDLGVRSLASEHRMGVKAWYEHLSKCDKFPYEMLRK